MSALTSLVRRHPLVAFLALANAIRGLPMMSASMSIGSLEGNAFNVASVATINR